MAMEPGRPWRDVVFICDECQHFATVGENDSGGDEKFFSLSRQARLVALVATQSIRSLRSAMPGESWRTLLQTLWTRVFLTLADEVSCKRASEACGQDERLKEQYSIAESSQVRVGLLSGRARGRIGHVLSDQVVLAAAGAGVPAIGICGIAQRAGDCGGLRRAQPAATYVLLSQAVVPAGRAWLLQGDRRGEAVECEASGAESVTGPAARTAGSDGGLKSGERVERWRQLFPRCPLMESRTSVRTNLGRSKVSREVVPRASVDRQPGNVRLCPALPPTSLAAATTQAHRP